MKSVVPAVLSATEAALAAAPATDK
jgi:hypothetical protein